MKARTFGGSESAYLIQRSGELAAGIQIVEVAS
jgi:hypothetical protein